MRVGLARGTLATSTDHPPPMTARYAALGLLLALLTAAPSSAATCTWNGSANPWATASAWSCGAVPSPSDDVVIGSGTVTLDAAVEVRDLTFTGGTLDGPGDLAVRGALVWEAGVMAGTGTTLSLGTATLRAATTKGVGRRVRLAGTSTWSDGTIGMRSGGTLVNEGVFTDDAVGTHSIARTGEIAVEPVVFNVGDWRVLSGGTNTNVDFFNGGVLGGHLHVGGGGFKVIAPGRFTNTVAGAVSGTSLLDLASGAVVSVSGITAPSGSAVGSFPVRGPFPMTADHTLDVDLRGGSGAFDRLLVEDGTVTVDGRLLVRVSDLAPLDIGAAFPILSQTGSGDVVGCYGPEDIVVTEPDGITAAPYRVEVACTADGVTATVFVASTAGEGGPDGVRGALTVTGAHPFSGRTALALTTPTASRVTVEAFDALGRRVAVLFEGAVAAGQSVPVAFEAGALPAGLYVVRAAGDGFSLARTLTLTR